MLNTWLRWLGFKNPLPNDYEIITHAQVKSISNVQDKTKSVDSTTEESCVAVDQITK